MKTLKPKEKREKPEQRTHQTYVEKPHWNVVNIERVDNLFITSTGKGDIRIDLDGFVHPGTEGELKEKSNINLSVWISKNHAEKISQEVSKCQKNVRKHHQMPE